MDYSHKALLTVKETCDYTGIGKTKMYEILNDPSCTYCVRIGRRVYANKELLDKSLKKNAKFHLKYL